MPPKRSKSGAGSAAGQKWEQGLLSTLFVEDDKWTATVNLVVGSKVEDYFHISHLTNAINDGSRRKFSVVTRDSLYEQVVELGNPKTKKAKETPMFYEVCEPCKTYIDNQEDIPVPLLAKLLKFKLLEVKQNDLKRIEEEKRGGAEKGSDKGKKGEKGKERSKSPNKGKGGKKTPEQASPKTGSKLKKRGEEDTSGKYIDDEPDDGPSHYIFIVGFHHPHLLSQLTDVGIQVDSIFKVESEDYNRFHPPPPDIDPKDLPPSHQKDDKTLENSKEENTSKISLCSDEISAEEEAQRKKDKLSSELNVFWKDVLLLMRQAPDDSKLHDVARLHYTVKESTIPVNMDDAENKKKFCATIYEDVACMVYDLLDTKRQWLTYLSNLKLVHIPNQSELNAPATTIPESHSQHSVTPAPPANLQMVTTAGASSGEPSEAVELKLAGPDVDMRYYNELMNCVPQECVSVPLLMHCMVEQIVATEEGKVPPSLAPPPPRTDGIDEELAYHISSMAYKLALSEEEQQELGSTPSHVVLTNISPNQHENGRSLSQDLERPSRHLTGLKQPKLISYRDSMAQRMHLLKAIDGFDPWKEEMSVLLGSPLLDRIKVPKSNAKLNKERSARLQEVINFCATGTVTQTDIDHAFKQFVMECMSLASVDAEGNVIPAEQEPLIPWDDPYYFFKGLPVTEEYELEEEKQVIVAEEPKESAKSRSVTPPAAPVDVPATENSPPTSVCSTGILKSPNKTRSRSPSSRKSSVHFEKDISGNLVPQPGDDENGEKEQTDSPFPNRTVEESMKELINLRKRNLDQWCFAEHLEPAVLLQVLSAAAYTHPYMDTYYHKRDRSLFVTLNSPHNEQCQRQEIWQTSLHSNCGFRNYLEHVAHSIEDWVRDQEAKYQASLLAAEVEKLNKDTEEASSRPGSAKNKGKGRDRSKSPKKSPSRTGRSSSRGSSTERSSSTDFFVRAGTLKAMKEEMERQRAEEEERERAKAEKRSKSATKQDKESREKRPSSSSKSRQSKEPESAPTEAEPAVESEKFWPFTGYDMNNQMVHVSGITKSLFPADGGQIRAERIQFIQAQATVKVTVLKDGHQFMIHVIDPREDPFAEDKLNVETVPSVSETQCTQKEKAETEISEKEAFGATEDSAVDSIAGGPIKPCVGQFGSFVGQFNDGLCISLSAYGDSGEPINGKPYEPTPYTVPIARSPSPQLKETAAKGKGKEKDKDKNKVAAPSTPEPSEVPMVEEPKELVPENASLEQPFQELSLTCPDGLQIRYALESSLGIIPDHEDDRKLVVKQSYPFKTNGKQQSEQGRRRQMLECSRTIVSDGTVVKIMEDNSVVVLYPDGKVSSLNDISTLQSARTRSESPQRTASEAQVDPEPTPSARDTKESKKRKDRNKSAHSQEILEEKAEKEPSKVGEWLTTKPSGERYRTGLDGSALEVKDVLVCTASDPMTKQQMYTREDHVVTVTHPDGTVIVEHSDGTRITTYFRQLTVSTPHSEETGEKSEPENKIVKFVFVECPGYATVKFDTETTECSTEFGTGTIVHAFPTGNYDVYHCDGGYLQIDTDGQTLYFPRPNNDMEIHDPEQQLVYSMCHFSDVVVSLTDNEGNQFCVRNTGVCEVQTKSEHILMEGTEDVAKESGEQIASQAENEEKQVDSVDPGEEVTERENTEVSEQVIDVKDEGKKIVHFKQHAPRFFIIHADGSGTELLRYQDLSEYVSTAEDDPATAMLMDPLADYPGVMGLTVLKPYLKNNSDKWLLNYSQPSIMPPGLTSRDLKSLPSQEFKKEGPPFGTNVGQGLNVGSIVRSKPLPIALKCPEKLELRQIVQFRPVTDDLRSKLEGGLQAYANFISERSEESEGFLVQDPRSEEEKINAEDLQATFKVTQNPPTSFTEDHRPSSRLQRDIKNLYEKATVPAQPEVPMTPMTKRTRVDLERDKRELQEEIDNREALRNHQVPGYFDSELGKAFLLSQKVIENAVSIVKMAPDVQALTNEAKRVQKSNEEPQQLLPADRKELSNSVPPPDLPVSGVVCERSISSTPPNGNPGALQPNQINALQTEYVSSENAPSSLRPWNPTPAHATGEGSPSALRPTNPTPAQAYKQLSVRPASETENSYKAKSLETNVVGEPRVEPVRIPQYIYSSKPGMVPNTRFAHVEEPVRRKVNTSSVASAQLKRSRNIQTLRGFELLPDNVNFGTLKEGNTYAFTVYLKNIGVDACRFKITQPPPSTGIKVLFKPGPIAAGMKAELQIEIYAIAVGVEGESGVGKVSHNLEIVTETDQLYLPIRATVLTAHEYDITNETSSRTGSKSPGVRFLSNKAPSEQGIIRPRKIYTPGSESLTS